MMDAYIYMFKTASSECTSSWTGLGTPGESVSVRRWLPPSAFTGIQPGPRLRCRDKQKRHHADIPHKYQSPRTFCSICAYFKTVKLGLSCALRLIKPTRAHACSHPSPVFMASASLDFHCSATSLAKGSSGLGALSNAWIDSRTVRICRAGDHLSRNNVIIPQCK